MKKLKDLLREFREKTNNNDGGGLPNEDPIEQGLKAMDKIPFTHLVSGDHEMHFKSSKTAADEIAFHRELHNFGLVESEAVHNDRRMSDFFHAAVGTHNSLLRAIETRLENHPNFPQHLKPHLPDIMAHIDRRAKSKANTLNTLGSVAIPGFSGYGSYYYAKHMAPISGADHPHLWNDEHHLQGVIKYVREDPDEGYYLRKEERE